IPEASTRVFALESGAIQLAQNNILAKDLDHLRHNKHVAVYDFSGWNVSYVGMNLQHPILANVQVRQALAAAIDRRAIAKSILQDTVVLNDSLLPSQHWAHANVEPLVYDPRQAAQLLD